MDARTGCNTVTPTVLRRCWSRGLAALGLLFAGVVSAGDALVVDAPTALKLVRADQVTLIDVRTLEEWTDTGVPEGATAIALQDPDFLRKVMVTADRDRSRPVLLICRTGRRSGIAADLLLRAGFLNVANVREGVAGRSGVGPGWVERGLPMLAYDPARHAPAPIPVQARK